MACVASAAYAALTRVEVQRVYLVAEKCSLQLTASMADDEVMGGQAGLSAVSHVNF